MKQKGTASLIPLLFIMVGLVVGVYFIERSTGFLSNAFEMVGPSKSSTIKIPIKTPSPSLIATSSATPATSSAKPKATATASASVKASAKPSATASASPK